MSTTASATVYDAAYTLELAPRRGRPLATWTRNCAMRRPLSGFATRKRLIMSATGAPTPLPKDFLSVDGSMSCLANGGPRGMQQLTSDSKLAGAILTAAARGRPTAHVRKWESTFLAERTHPLKRSWSIGEFSC